MGGTIPGKQRTLDIPFGVSIRQFKHERRIQVAFSFRGEQCREILAPCPITQSALTHAAGLRAVVLHKIGEGTFRYSEYFPNSRRAQKFDAAGPHVLVCKLLDKQIDAYERQVENGTLSPSTLDGYRKAINSERMKFWNDVVIRDATPGKLREWISSMDVTAKRARNLLTPLRSVFEDALNDELIDYNPFDRIALNKLLKQTTRSSDYEVDPFTAAERLLLLDSARQDERPMLQFWFNTGLRPGELMAMRWAKVNLTRRVVKIDRNLVGGVEKGPKTDAGVRDVELNDEAMAGLSAQKATTYLSGGHVWHNPRTGKPWERDEQIRKTLWQPLCARSGVRYRNPYQVRHTYASERLTAGENPWYVAQQLGHIDVQMVFQTYGKFISQDFKRPKARSLQLVAGG